VHLRPRSDLQRQPCDLVDSRQVERTVELTDGRRISADVILFSVGVKPELALARAAGLALGPSGALEVDEHLRTSDPDIYAAGDMAEVLHKVTGRRARMPLAGPANRQGPIAASNALGRTTRDAGALGTSVGRCSKPLPLRRASPREPRAMLGSTSASPWRTNFIMPDTRS
jgi:NADPH-dependent 2,4-dienoyl-CoA reductase/sulfur reductase-like enzyme